MLRHLMFSLIVLTTSASSAHSAMAQDHSTAAPITLSCQLRARVVGPGQVELRFDVRNQGRQAVHLLRWGTPFEGGWFSAFVSVRNAQGALLYQGATVKRGEPATEDYLRLAPGHGISRRLRLEQAFDLPAAAHAELTVQSQWRWHDALVVGRGKVPRPREQHQPLEQDCGGAHVRL
jgi:hypothetical protein